MVVRIKYSNKIDVVAEFANPGFSSVKILNFTQ